MFVHPLELRLAYTELRQGGLNDSQIGRELGVPRATVREWSRIRPFTQQALCPRCWKRTRPIALTAEGYAELLGLYLGDGYICPVGRTFRLRIFLDSRYPGVIADTYALLARGFPANRVASVRADASGMTTLFVHSLHLPCLLPQHGPGLKHQRPIVLEPWQRALVDAAPWDFLRGCIRSDGCVFVNRTGRYSYLTYDFSNLSKDILGLFGQICEQVELDVRVYERRARINRGRSVQRLLAHVGLKE